MSRPSENGSVPDSVREALRPLDTHEAELEARASALEDEAKGLRTDARRIKRMKRAAGLTEPKKRDSPSGATDASLSKQMEERISQGIQSYPDEEFTVLQLAEHCEVSEATARKGIAALRDREVRLVGDRVPAGSQSAMKAAHFRRIKRRG
jgi:hypothetical protein